jgi:hypothetical protein
MPEKTPTCAACGEVIGVHEPVVVVDAHGEATPDEPQDAPLAAAAPLRYHMACWSAASRCGERAA